jgi:hypothetical protein
MGPENIQRTVRRAEMYSRVTSLAPQDLSVSFQQIVGGDIPGADVFTTMLGLGAEMSKSMTDAKRRRIQSISLDIPHWDEDHLGRGITLRNKETNDQEPVGRILPILRDREIVEEQRLFVLNNGMVFVGVETPSQKPEDKAQFQHSAEPYALTAINETVYEVGSVVKDNIANEILQLVEARGMKITLLSNNDADLDALGEVVDETMKWVDETGEYRRHTISQDYDPVVAYVEKILEDAGEMSDSFGKMTDLENL